MNDPHVCFSGSNSCSGCNPCEACALHVRQCVLPVAMIAAGFNKEEAQSEAFFQGYKFGWQRLHDAMMGDPELKQQYAARILVPAQEQLPPFGPGAGAVQQQSYPLTPEPEAQVQVQGQAYAPTINGAVPPFVPVTAAPPAPPPVVYPGLSISEEDLQRPMDLSVMKSMLDDVDKRQTGGAVISEGVANPRVRNAPQVPMDPEDIAAAAVAPVVLGNVMHVPK